MFAGHCSYYPLCHKRVYAVCNQASLPPCLVGGQLKPALWIWFRGWEGGSGELNLHPGFYLVLSRGSFPPSGTGVCPDLIRRDLFPGCGTASTPNPPNPLSYLLPSEAPVGLDVSEAGHGSGRAGLSEQVTQAPRDPTLEEQPTAMQKIK